MKKQLISLIGGIACLGAVSSAQAVIIDNFSAPGHALESTAGVIGSVSNQQSQAGPIGGQRDFYINVTGNGGSANTIALNADTGSLSHNQGAQMVGTSTIQWDGTDANSDPFVNSGDVGGIAFGLGGVDLTTGGADAFGIFVVSNPSFAFNINVKIFEDADNFASGNVQVGALASNAQEFISFAAMTVTGTVDFASVEAIEITFLDVTAGTSPNIQFIQSFDSSVPTPTLLVLMGTGLTALGFTRRKRTQAQ